MGTSWLSKPKQYWSSEWLSFLCRCHPVDAQPVEAFAGHPKTKALPSVSWVTCLCTLDDDCVGRNDSPGKCHCMNTNLVMAITEKVHDEALVLVRHATWWMSNLKGSRSLKLGSVMLFALNLPCHHRIWQNVWLSLFPWPYPVNFLPSCTSGRTPWSDSSLPDRVPSRNTPRSWSGTI